MEKEKTGLSTENSGNQVYLLCRIFKLKFFQEELKKHEKKASDLELKVGVFCITHFLK